MSDYETNYKKSYAQDYGQPYGQSYGKSYSRYDDESETNWSYLLTGALFIAAGAYLIYRGISSDDELHEYGDSASGGGYDTPANTGERSEASEDKADIEVNESIVINKAAAELYSYWRNLENLPQIMSHLESVTETGTRSHWKAKAPLGLNVEWDATVTEDRPDELISWRSDEDAQVPNEGSVRFSGVGSSTEVLVSLTYHPPLGPVGAALAKLFGQEPSQQVSDDLQKFKQAVESGTLALGGGGLADGLGNTSESSSS